MSLYLGDKPIANDGSHNTANVDLSNLSETGEAHFANPSLTNSPYTTNRILEIPQDIKLELNNGTLTLKAGSKVYIPNGVGVFDSFTLLSDAGSGDISGISTDYLFFVNSVGGLFGASKAMCYSGTVEPTGTNGVFWYDTTNNIVKRHNGTSWVSGFSLPFCAISSGASSIDQIFNGFGYIGSTVFALPGVKYEYANGLNSDGACVNGFGETTSVITTTYTYITSTTQSLFIVNNNDIWRCGLFSVVENPPTSGPAYCFWYVQSLNCFYSTYDGTTVPKSHKGMPFIQIASNIETNSSFKVTNIDFEGVDGLLTSNANNLSPIGRSYLSGLGMPSNSGYLVSDSFSSSTNFVAPANGYFRFRAMSVAAGEQLVFLMNQSSRLMVGGSFHKSAAGQGSNIILPAKKGQTIQVQYNNSNLTADPSSGLWFIPCEGEN